MRVPVLQQRSAAIFLVAGVHSMKSEMPCLDDDVPLVDVEGTVEGFQCTHAAHSLCCPCASPLSVLYYAHRAVVQGL